MPSSTPLPPDLTKGPFSLADVRRLGLSDQIGRGHVTVAPGQPRPRARGIVSHRTTSTEATTWRGVRITTAEQTFVDLARTLSPVEAVVLGDALVRRGFTTVARLRSVSNACDGRHAIAVRRAGSLVRPRVDSPMESRLKLLFVFAGLPCPEPGLEILDDDGQWVATVDLRYARARIAIEYDSDLHRTRKRKWRQDVAGRERLRELGWQVVVVTVDDICVRPHRTLERVHDALRLRGGEPAPPSLDPRWREHFAPRGHASEHW